jgi:TolB-like protein
LLLSGLALFALIAALPYSNPMGSSDSPSIFTSQKSLAVLPFNLHSKNAELAYLANGLPSELISQFSINPDILVMDKRSSFAFKDKQQTPIVVSEKLGVDYVLMGTLFKEAEDTQIKVCCFSAVK